RAIAAETEQPAIAAQMVMSANALGGRSTLIRRADGSLVAGDPLPDETALRVRDLKLPAVLPVADASGRRVAVLPAGPGLALIAAFPAGELDDPVLAALGSIGTVGGAALGAATERDRLEEERRELLALADRLRSDLRARDDAVASTVHELRTPLTSVSAYGQLIARQLQSALQQLAQIDRLIGDLRSDATMGLALTEVNVATEASEAVRRQRVLNRADVDLRIGAGAPFVVRADAGRLAQVLDNVLGNAVKFSPPDGRIDLSVDRVDGEVVISISDEGPGLATEDLEHIFERYYRARTTSTRVPGLGIGLAVSREIVQAHGGRIWAESPGEGRGSTFKIALPTATADVSAKVR
ncbi:MAG TPA: ATP-binding protein, partial [Candidatus Limnocylindria bacterium]|nr:ATP-binding protein [Candidatus Limnocylindria bacterium]